MNELQLFKLDWMTNQSRNFQLTINLFKQEVAVTDLSKSRLKWDDTRHIIPHYSSCHPYASRTQTLFPCILGHEFTFTINCFYLQLDLYYT